MNQKAISILTKEQSAFEFAVSLIAVNFLLHAEKSFRSPLAAIMENKDAQQQQQQPKASPGLLIVEGGFEDQVCAAPCSKAGNSTSEANSLFQTGELALYLERVRKSKDKADVLTEEKLIEMLKKGEKEEIVQILTSESAALATGAEKGTT